MISARQRAQAFCAKYGLEAPIILAPMAGAQTLDLSVEVAGGGGMGSLGALITPPEAIRQWAEAFRARSNRAFQVNLWTPQSGARDPGVESAMRKFLADWGPPVPDDAGGITLPDFTAQCEAILEAAPQVVSSIMGVFSADYVARLKAKGIAWFANATTLDEARQAEAAGADAVVAQGFEAGGHRGVLAPAGAAGQGPG